MEKHNKTELASLNNIVVSQCSCGGYKMQYKCVSVHLSDTGLLTLMELAYNHERKINESDYYGSFEVIFGSVVVSIDKDDFNDFHEVLRIATNVSTNIEALISSAMNS